MKLFKQIFIVVLLTLSANIVAAPSSEVWDIWAKNDDTSTQVVDHSKWQAILDAYLNDETTDGVNRFAYGKVTSEDKKKLKTYLKELTSLDPRTLAKDEAMAYWINMYNALTIDVVLDDYPVKSIRSIRFLTSPFGPWDKKLLKVAGERITLNDIEHRILRPIWQDERIHFAVNCASIGCPNLQRTAFNAENLDVLLEKGAEEFINHPRGVSRNGDKLMLSSIFDWYGVDFGTNENEVVEALTDFISEEHAQKLEGYTTVKYDYDWSLNE
ncbi:MAG: DUF547 domain-containing protein [Acidiferrobacterales bacterium]|nr:DUF547 domain-containing protein [Acidiferrobacterales bacterium]